MYDRGDNGRGGGGLWFSILYRGDSGEGRKSTLFLVLQGGDGRDTVEGTRLNRGGIKGEVEGKGCMLEQGRQRGRGECLIVHGLQCAPTTFSSCTFTCIYFPLRFYRLCITRYFYRIHSTVDQTKLNNYVHVSADFQCVVDSFTRTRR